MKFNLDKPFPSVDKPKDKLLFALAFGLFVYVFLIIFQPFGINNITNYNKPFFVLGYGMITFLVLIGSFFLQPLFRKDSDSEQWSLKEVLIFTSMSILIIATLNWLYTSIIGSELRTPPSFFKFILITIAIGIIPTSFFILFLEQYLSSKNESKANTVTNNIQTAKLPIQNTIIKFGQKQQQFSLNLSDLLCVKADGNYVEIYHLYNNKVEKKLIRSSLSKVKKQLEEHTQIKHCHRSFIVNTEHIEKVTGNARNFNLHLKHLDFSIPVSRSFPIDSIK